MWATIQALVTKCTAFFNGPYQFATIAVPSLRNDSNTWWATQHEPVNQLSGSQKSDISFSELKSRCSFKTLEEGICFRHFPDFRACQHFLAHCPFLSLQTISVAFLPSPSESSCTTWTYLSQFWAWLILIQPLRLRLRLPSPKKILLILSEVHVCMCAYICSCVHASVRHIHAHTNTHTYLRAGKNSIYLNKAYNNLSPPPQKNLHLVISDC